MLNIELSKNEIEKWKNRTVVAGSVSQVLHRLSEHYKINKFEVASLAADIFEENFTGEDMQVLWKWNMDRVSGGLEDHEIDALLKHLLR